MKIILVFKRLINRRPTCFRLILLSVSLLFVSEILAQEYGLGFAGKPNSKDRRTQLDLNPDRYLSFSGEFELAFQIRIRRDFPGTFGYVFRIVDEDENNVDLLFSGPDSNSLQLVSSNMLTDLSISYPDSGIHKRWTEIKAIFNPKKQTLQLRTPDTTLYASDIPLAGKVKIFFGRNSFTPVQTTDVPTMDIKDIKISRNGNTIHHFPLDELEGDMAYDIISKKKALVQNPVWIRPKYHNWGDFHVQTHLDGFVPICYAPDQEKLYLVGDSLLKVISLLTDSIENYVYPSPFTGLTIASQAFYDSTSKRLICYNHRDRLIHAFNFAERRWEELFNGPNNVNRLWFHNKFYDSMDSILYMFGGYSQHRYSKLVMQFDFRNFQWDTIKVDTAGDVFHPRMHAALGILGDTVYIMGGFGSTSGDQKLNPRHYNDLIAFSLKDKRFSKIYDFDSPIKNIDFAQSMVFDSNGEDFYVLASSIYEYESNLQLLKGSLSNPELTAMGTKIPYLFHNENSYSDLFYSKSLQQLIAVTSLADRIKNETTVEVYKMSYPPFPAEINETRMKRLIGNAIWIIPVLLILAVFLFFGVRRFTRKSKTRETKSTLKGATIITQSEQERTPAPDLNKRREANSIIFFGGFQVINQQGEDITRKFTPLLKELFLLIFLYSVKDKGISVPRLTELLWFSMSSKSAKNNRAVNIAKLKHLLGEIDCCSLSRKTEYWRIEFEESAVYSDYLTFHRLTMREDQLSKDDLEKLLKIVRSGPLLGNASYEWLDEFKLDCSNRITDVLVKYLALEKISDNPELMVRIADAILIFDIMHEDAIVVKCKALTELGKHSLGKEIFIKFARDYQTLYDEPYQKSYTDIIKQ